jgi:hypothetical protein
MSQNSRVALSQDDLSNFEEFIQSRSQYSNLVDPRAFPVKERDRQNTANIIEGIDRVSVQGILVPAVVSHLHEEYGKHVAIVCNEYRVTKNRNTHACWVEAAAEGQRDRLLDGIRCSLEHVPPAITRDLLLGGVLTDSEVAQACLIAANAMSSELSTALSDIENAFQGSHRMLGEMRHLVECKCSSADANDEFLESCCEVSRQISARREQLHITFSTVIKVVEGMPRWETRRDALRTLNKLYWKCKNCNVFLRDGEWETDVVKKQLIDLMGGMAEGMGPLERQRYMDEGFSFNVLDSLEGKVYESLKDLKRATDNLRASRTRDSKDPTTPSHSQRSRPHIDSTKLGDKHMSDTAGVKKAETKRLKRRRVKDRKALQKALASLGLGDIDEHAA